MYSDKHKKVVAYAITDHFIEACDKRDMFMPPRYPYAVEKNRTLLHPAFTTDRRLAIQYARAIEKRDSYYS